MSEDIKQMKTHNKGNLLINYSSMLYIFNTKEFMLDFIEYVTNLQNELQQKDNIIKEVREILNQDKASASFNTAESIALNILDKVEENK